MGESSYKGTIQKLTDEMGAFGSDLFDYASHTPDSDWGRWKAFKSLAMKIAIQANAIEEGMGHTFYDISGWIKEDLPNSVAEAPGVIGHAVGEAASGVGNAAGGWIGGFLSGAG